MKTSKCMNCRWYVVMKYKPPETMCHYNWMECKDVKDDECHFKPKREDGKE